MDRSVRVRMVTRTTGPARIELAVAVARGPQFVSESLDITFDGAPRAVAEVAADVGGRLHLLDVDRPGQLVIEYVASVHGRALPAPATVLDAIVHLRPSRYCESDRLTAHARAEFGGLGGADLVQAVGSWVNNNLQYVIGSSRPIDGAVSTLLLRQGVCRDFAHLVIAILRARDVPARLAAVYAPGLQPMDFHAVAEAYIGGAWRVVDATGLAPRQSMLRIATGRDAADTAFLTTYGSTVDLMSLEVTAVVDGDLPFDEFGTSAELG